MFSIVTGSFLISLLHALIPNHWLPILAIGRRENWSLPETTRVTLIAGFAHVFSTVVVGLILAVIGNELSAHLEHFTRFIGPSLLILMGFYFIRQHYRHHHFHLEEGIASGRSKKAIILALVMAMSLSPCMEIEGYFLLAGNLGWYYFGLIALMYAIITLVGMAIWIRIVYKGLIKLNWHRLEHNAGIITGVILIATGIVSFFIY